MTTMAKGYILLARSIKNSDVASMSPCTRELWTYLLRAVNYADHGKIKRGQGFFSLERIQNDLEWWVGYRRETYSKPELTKALRRLREGNMIDTAKETRGLLVTVCKYDHYQDPNSYEGNAKATRKQREGNTIGHTISEEGKKKEERTAIAVPRATTPEEFKAQCAEVAAEHPDLLPPSLRKGFFDYWTERDARGRMRLQAEKHFEIPRRMTTWRANAEKRGEIVAPSPERKTGWLTPDGK